MARQAKNMKELNAMLERQLRKAMNDVRKTALADMQEATDRFYAGGNPKKYERTYELGETPTVTPISVSKGNNVSEATFAAYLDESHKYTTGKGPAMADVLKLANDRVSPTPPNHLRATVGEPHFWESAEREMEDSLNKIIEKNFG